MKQFGCEAFSLLFDDIDTDMCSADKEVFQTFAHAQVSVTNEVFQHLGQPKFFFCPTGNTIGVFVSLKSAHNIGKIENINVHRLAHIFKGLGTFCNTKLEGFIIQFSCDSN